jgi:hypothetical protein
MEGPPIVTVVAGLPHDYTTTATCTHPWFKDPDSSWTPYYDEPLDWSHTHARAAYDRGYTQGVADRGRFNTCPCTHCTRQELP